MLQLLCWRDNVPPNNTANTESWDGTSWTEVGDLNQQDLHIMVELEHHTTRFIFAGGPTPPLNLQKQNIGMELLGQKLMIYQQQEDT